MAIELTVRGNLGQNIAYKEILRNGEQSAVVNFSIASTDYRNEIIDGQEQLVAGKTEWLECEYWNRQAQKLSTVLQKGMPVTVTGREIVYTYTNKDGLEVTARKIRVDRIYLILESSRIEAVTLRPPRQADNTAAATSSDADEKIPF